jgi:DNA polymerase III delta prime subunit
MNNVWYEKYRPQHISDMLISKEDANKAIQWITDFKNKKEGSQNCLFLYGDPGIGKTTLANIILAEYGYDICEFNASEVRNQKQIRDQINEINGKCNVIDFMQYKKKHIGIIMDEIDGMNTTDRGGLTELIDIMFKTNKTKKKSPPVGSPFICISNSIDKKIRYIKEHSVSIKMVKPSKFMLVKLATRVMNSENIPIDTIGLNLIVSHAGGDYRRLINIIEFIFSGKNVDYDSIYNNIETTIHNFDKKNVFFSAYEITDKIFNTSLTNNQIYDYYHLDPNLVYLLMYENMPNLLIKNRKGSDSKKIEILSNIYDKFSEGDKYENSIYKYQHWYLNNYNAYEKAIHSYNIINTLDKYSVNRDNSINYSSLINKISLEHTNSKLLAPMNKTLLNYSNVFISDHVCNIIVHYLFHDFDLAITLLKKYQVPYELVEKKILKNIVIDPKIKKEIKSSLEQSIKII